MTLGRLSSIRPVSGVDLRLAIVMDGLWMAQELVAKNLFFELFLLALTDILQSYNLFHDSAGDGVPAEHGPIRLRT